MMVNTVWATIFNGWVWFGLAFSQLVLYFCGSELPAVLRWFPGIILGVFILAILAGAVLAGLGER